MMEIQLGELKNHEYDAYMIRVKESGEPCAHAEASTTRFSCKFFWMYIRSYLFFSFLLLGGVTMPALLCFFVFHYFLITHTI